MTDLVTNPLVMLKLCQFALNRVKNTQVDHTHFKDTYALASMLDDFIKASEEDAAKPRAPDPIAWELEICFFVMGEPDEEGCSTFSEGEDDIASYNVMLELRFEDTGEIHPLIDATYTDADEASAAFDALSALFPDASHNIWPE